MLLAGGCTRTNPAFDAGGTELVTGEASATSIGETTSPGATTVAGLDTGSSAGDGPIDTSSTGAAACNLDDDQPIGFNVATLMGRMPPAISPGCNGVFAPAHGPLMTAGDTVVLTACGACTCGGASPQYAITMIDAVFPELPACGQVVMWEGLGLDGQCHWQGLAVREGADGDAPVYVASNSRRLPDPPFARGSGLGWQAVASCETDVSCNVDQPGRFGLTVTDGSVLVPGQSDVMLLPFAGSPSYLVENRMSSLGLDCREHVAWTARIQ